MKLCLFLTYGMSLKRWDELGILERELAFYQKLSELGIKISLFTYGDQRDLGYAASYPLLGIFPAYAYLSKPKSKILRFLQSLRFAKRFKPFFKEQDLLKTNQMWGAWISLAAQKIAEKPLILRVGYEAYQAACFEKRTWILRIFIFLLSWWAYQTANAVVLTSSAAKNFVIKTFRISDEKIAVIPNFIEKELMNCSDTKPIYDQRTLFVGRLVEAKNLFAAIKACSQANLGFDIIGDGPLRFSLEEYAKSLHADVRFLGKLKHSQVMKEIPKYSFCLLSSYYEGSPKALLEMMVCGRAVVGTRVQGIEEIIRDRETGLLTGTSDEELASGIFRMIKFPELCRDMGLQARQYAEEHFSFEPIKSLECELYLKLTEKAQPACCV